MTGMADTRSLRKSREHDVFRDAADEIAGLFLRERPTPYSLWAGTAGGSIGVVREIGWVLREGIG